MSGRVPEAFLGGISSIGADAHKMPVPSPSDGVWERAFYALSALCVRDIQGLAHDGGNHLLLPQVRRQVANLLQGDRADLLQQLIGAREQSRVQLGAAQAGHA